jgi:hypothetical protein
MKRLAACLLFLVCGLSGCAWKQQLPVPAPLGGKAVENGPGIFPVGRWQFVHAIDFSMDNSDGATVIGIVRLEESRLDVALVTVEGLTLFEAGREDGKEPVIRRAVLPFGNKGFAASLLADVEMIFRAPAGRPSLGRSPGGEQVWQYLGVDGERTDLLPEEAGCWRLNRYDPAGRLQRQLKTMQCREEAGILLPGYIELHAEPAGYHLRMRLISATRLQDA